MLGVAVERIAGVVEVVAVAELNGAVVGEVVEADPLLALVEAAVVDDEGRINAVRTDELEDADGVGDVVRAVVAGVTVLEAGVAVLFAAASTIALNATDLGTEAALGFEGAVVTGEGCEEGDALGAVDAIFAAGSVFAAGVAESGAGDLAAGEAGDDERPPAGFCPPCRALIERRRARPFSEVGLSKFNSPGAAPGSG